MFFDFQLDIERLIVAIHHFTLVVNAACDAVAALTALTSQLRHWLVDLVGLAGIVAFWLTMRQIKSWAAPRLGDLAAGWLEHWSPTPNPLPSGGIRCSANCAAKRAL